MIHYMLLPKEEMRILRREYRVRLSIIVLFFASCAILAGMIGLLPSFAQVRAEKKELLAKFEELEKTRKENGAEQIEKDLLRSQAIAKKILETENDAVYSSIVEKVIAKRPQQVALSFLDLGRSEDTATTTLMSVQGKAANREALLEFKKRLESDPAIKSVELPLSDLAKSRNVAFTVKIMVSHE